MGDCLKEMWRDVYYVKAEIERFSVRAENETDDMILWLAKSLVIDIERMIETKKAIAENMRCSD